MILERLLEPRLTRLAKDIVDTRRPFVVAISGSVGKTAAKDAVACVLREWTHTMASPENQNDELGVPLSIIGARPSGRNPLGWLATLQRARRILGSGGSFYPECLVLEFGSCHVGDVEHLMHLSTPDVGVLTAIEPTHLQFYDSLGAIELEEGKVVTMLPASGTGILNADNPGAAAAADRASCRIVTYGLEAGADVRGVATASAIDWDRLTGCTHLDVECCGLVGALRIEGTVGAHSCYAPLAALGVAQAIGIPFAEAMRALRSYVPPPGRMQCRPGLNRSLVIDDTYNSSPAAAIKALDALATAAPQGESAETIAVLGPMAELGPTSRSQHEAIGRHAAKLSLDRIVTVGNEARDTARAAREAGMPTERVLEVRGPDEAIRALMECAEPGNVVLVKGSQSSRMERVASAMTDAGPRENARTPVMAA